ncbi:hypothetical protein B0J13DRAFT_641217 [Dactylonectria estremocensis]|uniref:Azaphilone pigments biosynthesis cluster protein L N-terminal domain-containing protein n=1 Tax=Dactylonectria estremocensis TaxID=1079267 RepID=A0A9P9ECH4_9HYPO|nr:hypothetical protein B0J13DRAFT_641217 [Dactylonectria estremocensis]
MAAAQPQPRLIRSLIFSQLSTCIPFSLIILMDPKSLAFGVVSLAMQLVQTATTIQKLIAIYKSAAKELASLSEKLEDIEVICHSLEVALTASEQAPKPWDAILLKKLHKTMADCRDNIVLLHELISKITSGPARKRNPISTMGAMFLQYRGKIRQYNEDLDSSLQSLHLQMTTNLLYVNAKLNRKGYRPELIKPSHSQEAEYWRQGWFSLFCLQKTKIRKISTNFCGSDLVTREDLSFLAGSPLLGLYVKLSIQRGSIRPLSISIQFPHILEMYLGSSSTGKRLEIAMLLNDLGEFQKLLGEKLLSLDTMVTWDEKHADWDYSLFGLATACSAYDICRFLTQQVPEIPHQNHMSPNRTMVSIRGPAVDMRAAYDFIGIRGGCLTLLEFETLVNDVYDADYISECICASKNYISTDWEPFNLVVFNCVLEEFQKRDERADKIYDWNGWAKILADAISNGLDVHRPCRPLIRSPNKAYSAIFHIIDSTDTPNGALVEAEAWVDMLELAGVDIEEYLRVEIDQSASIWIEDFVGWHGLETVYKRQFVVRESKGRRLPCWVEVFPDSHPMREIFVELPHLRQKSSFGRRMVPYLRTREHLASSWKCPTWSPMFPLHDRSSLPSYPVYPPLDRGDLWYSRGVAKLLDFEQAQLAGLDRACDLMESRFERKQAKKRRKAGGMKALKRKGRMPGAWIYEFDY